MKSKTLSNWSPFIKRGNRSLRSTGRLRYARRLKVTPVAKRKPKIKSRKRNTRKTRKSSIEKYMERRNQLVDLMRRLRL